MKNLVYLYDQPLGDNYNTTLKKRNYLMDYMVVIQYILLENIFETTMNAARFSDF